MIVPVAEALTPQWASPLRPAPRGRAAGHCYRGPALPVGTLMAMGRRPEGHGTAA